MSQNTLVFFGDNNLQKDIWSVGFEDSRSSSSQDVQSVPLARASGSAVVNTRLESKEISISGHLIVDPNVSATDLDKLIRDNDIALNQPGERYLRFVRDWQTLFKLSNWAGYSVSDKASNASILTDKYQLSANSYGFDITSGDGIAVVQFIGSGTDISGFDDDENLEFWLYLPDTFYVESIQFRIGGAGSYYFQDFTSNYEGNPLKNGWNFFSVPFRTLRDQEVGTLNETTVDFTQVRITMGTGSDGVKGCAFDGLLISKESTLRNYPVFKTGSTGRSGNHYNVDFTEYSASFYNHTGYAVSTHDYELFEDTGVTSSASYKFEIEGTAQPLPLFNINVNTATDLANIRFFNLGNDESIEYKGDGIVASDILEFGGLEKRSTKNGQVLDFDGFIPEYQLGINRVGIQLVGAGSVSENNTPSINTFAGVSASVIRLAQSFTASITGTVDQITIPLSCNAANSVVAGIYTDNSGSPGTLVGSTSTVSGITSSVQNILISGLGASVTASTRYWIAIYDTNAPTFTTNNFLRWHGRNTNPLPSESAKRIDPIVDPTLWLPITNTDLNFIVNIDTSPSFDIDINASYRKLYQS